MNHLNFFPYHNRLITFVVDDEAMPKVGVIFDSIPSNRQKNTEYIFISQEHLKEWKLAESRGDTDTMNRLQAVIDIDKIIWVESDYDKAVYRAVSNVIANNQIPESLKHLYKKIQTPEGIFQIVKIHEGAVD